MIDVLMAVVLDFILGDPSWMPHPIRLFGRIIKLEEKGIRKFFKSEWGLRLGGFLIVIANMLMALLIPYYILKWLRPYEVPFHMVNIYLIYTSLAAKCLRDEAVKILRGIDMGIAEARYRLSFIVGRDTTKLQEGEIIRATVETVAENASDGVIAPLLFAIIGGAPFAMLYKMINTMDSMLGYMNIKYRYIGYFPAKVDDVFNYIPARLTGILMNFSCFLKYNGVKGFKIMLRDRKNHKSPNCAYPEGAVAGLLGIQLGGDNFYFGELMKKPKIGDCIRPLEWEDINRTIEIMFRAEIFMLFVYMLVEVIR